jgi:hypothetical protein
MTCFLKIIHPRCGNNTVYLSQHTHVYYVALYYKLIDNKFLLLISHHQTFFLRILNEIFNCKNFLTESSSEKA